MGRPARQLWPHSAHLVLFDGIEGSGGGVRVQEQEIALTESYYAFLSFLTYNVVTMSDIRVK